jgi:hypothetical protein
MGLAGRSDVSKGSRTQVADMASRRAEIRGNEALKPPAALSGETVPSSRCHERFASPACEITAAFLLLATVIVADETVRELQADEGVAATPRA